MDDFFQDSPFQKELQRAFQRQLTTLKDKNKELEVRVDDLEQKIALNVSCFG
jgi:cell division protein FtsB